MIAQKTATDVQHHTICHIFATTRCATAAAASGASSRIADDDDRIHPWIWAAILVENLVDDRFSNSIEIDPELKAEHREKIEANHPVVFDCTDLRITGTAGFPPGLSADASLDVRGSEAAGLWHTARRRAVKLAVGPPRQFAMTRWPFQLHIGSLLGGFAPPFGQSLLPRYQSGTTCP